MEVKKALHYGWYRALWRLREMREGNLKACWDSWSLGCVLTWNKFRRKVHLDAPCKSKPCGFSFSGEANTTEAHSAARRATRNCIMIFVTAMNNEESIKLVAREMIDHGTYRRDSESRRGRKRYYDHEKMQHAFVVLQKKAMLRPIRNFGGYFSYFSLLKKKGSAGGL